MRLFFRPNFLLTFSDLLVNLSAGWLGSIFILPGIWRSYDLQTNLVTFITNFAYGTICLFGSIYLKELNDAK